MKTSQTFLRLGNLFRHGLPVWPLFPQTLAHSKLSVWVLSGAKYGIATCHFYWIGAIPAMVFLGVFMMPFYYGLKGPFGS